MGEVDDNLFCFGEEERGGIVVVVHQEKRANDSKDPGHERLNDYEIAMQTGSSIASGEGRLGAFFLHCSNEIHNFLFG